MAFSMNQWWTAPSRPGLTRPKVLGCYSFDNNEFKDSSLAQLRYFYEPELSSVKFDLKERYEVTDKNFSVGGRQSIHRTLHWISNNSICITASPEEDRWLQPQFISNRRTFRLLLQAFYHKQYDWVLCASKYRGSIYLNYFYTDRLEKVKQQQPKELLRYSSWKYKIDEYFLTNDPHAPPNASRGIPGEEFACVYKTWLGNHSLLYSVRTVGTSAQEVVKDLEELKQTRFIDIKFHSIMKTEKQEHELRRWRSLAWWSTNVLADSEYVVCGLRDDSGIVKSLTKFTLRDLVTLGKDNWDSTVCLNFCNSFLSHIQSVVTRDYDDCVYKFEYTPGPRDAKARVRPVVNMEELESSSESFNKYSFLPSWYIEKCNELAA